MRREAKKKKKAYKFVHTQVKRQDLLVGGGNALLLAYEQIY